MNATLLLAFLAGGTCEAWGARIGQGRPLYKDTQLDEQISAAQVDVPEGKADVLAIKRSLWNVCSH
jgi:hypothetical protein